MMMKKVFGLFPGEEQYMDRGPSRCRTCAVVGNSNNLLGSSYGSQIDDHDFVMRMNEAKTIGYEKDVGRRTTHHFLYPESAIDLENNTNLVLIPFKMRDFEWLISVITDGSITVTYRRVPARIKFNKEKVLFYNPAFLKYVKEQWVKTHKYPSTGMLVLLFAIHICDEVSVYGYGADRYGLWKHYWEKIQGTKLVSKHSGNKEYDILQLLHEAGKIKLSKGSNL
ncbi:CMP-N-acetylneuraminate-beta-galactosamide-alpha-2,3-sialyltransferase 2-like isoform X2 [Conger conger]|nr:CMP-N-acetylneuraminate-beta-galactosamide-alpha-2,3-sialyltransferase 2-like isoform X2 [Conger conger]XP_061111322.1 CMP-N-acetylneuraminate-beta-galactosamide-alpha-2,3-sialyltransferase 2-like isoform X2 [Conger conger]XP_061111324.1 CMP-N-acetylneuraminate-beta-galactosamide-alpha-2,3-sialyltransferase 2-like isoform X2 [Conger conger]